VNDVEYDCIGCPYFNPSFQCNQMKSDALALLKEQEEQINRLEYDLAVAENNLNYYVNGND